MFDHLSVFCYFLCIVEIEFFTKRRWEIFFLNFQARNYKPFIDTYKQTHFLTIFWQLFPFNRYNSYLFIYFLLSTLQDSSDKETYFFEELSEKFDYLYCSIKYPKTDSGLSWYLGLKRTRSRKTLQGRAKRASRTLPGDSATHFSIFYEH